MLTAEHINRLTNEITDVIEQAGTTPNTNNQLSSAIRNIAVQHTTGVDNNLTSTATDRVLSSKQGKALKGLIDNINTLLTSSDVSLDSIQELVDFIKANRTTLNALGIPSISGLQTALNNKVDDNQVLTNVPVNAKFTDTTYSVADGGLTERNFTGSLKNKLDGMEANANNNPTCYWNTAGTYTVTLSAGKYFMPCGGGSGGRSPSYSGSSGGTSSIGSYITATATGGGGGYTSRRSSNYPISGASAGGAGGRSATSTTDVALLIMFGYGYRCSSSGITSNGETYCPTIS
ncbi:hypothetical protein CVPH_1351 [Abyssogena phaseoliformis symbiont OG214]|uniref:hypothetical protein n=1 Tax=Abyssogena phaseoliformis symbiont TaxID=596095 RepID=UPI0019162AAC|nr:hypothetical protein [Abyssogena phaseoliformis symbiont]BBB22287.1 hypothetical protein CVPH_0091 [Abyssogena phaseoliformis symbiont OG214]BBB23224.1 hypothetical protein CVPH_1351 [Abyssogena phaseoliformis symbiont OG214]